MQQPNVRALGWSVEMYLFYVNIGCLSEVLGQKVTKSDGGGGVNHHPNDTIHETCLCCPWITSHAQKSADCSDYVKT